MNDDREDVVVVHGVNDGSTKMGSDEGRHEGIVFGDTAHPCRLGGRLFPPDVHTLRWHLLNTDTSQLSMGYSRLWLKGGEELEVQQRRVDGGHSHGASLGVGPLDRCLECVRRPLQYFLPATFARIAPASPEEGDRRCLQRSVVSSALVRVQKWKRWPPGTRESFLDWKLHTSHFCDGDIKPLAFAVRQRNSLKPSQATEMTFQWLLQKPCWVGPPSSMAL